MANFYVSDTYKAIAIRLSGLSPSIDIVKHIDEVNGIRPKAGPTTLEGITFRPRDRDALLLAIRNARNGADKTFAEGSSFDVRHWALKASFSATHGIGFREIFRYNLSDRALFAQDSPRNPYAPRWSEQGSARFGDNLSMPDITSLHCAIADDVCNIHIDETGFVIESLNGDFSVGPDSIRHAAVELFLRTTVREAVKDNRVATWVIDHVSPIVPSTADGFRWGLEFEPVHTKNYRLKFTGSCALHGESECSVTGSFSGRHNLGSAPVKKAPKRL